MTKVLLSNDDSVFLHEGRYYAANQERMEFYHRYLRVFDSLRLVCRCEEEKKIIQERVPLDTDYRIDFFPIPMFHGPKQYAANYIAVGKALKNVTEGCDVAILRIPSTIAMRVGKQVMARRIPFACEVVCDAEDCWKASKGITRLLWKRIDKNMHKLCEKAEGVSCVTEHYLQQHYYPSKPDAFTEHYSSLALEKSFYGSEKKAPTHRPIVIAHVANVIGFDDRKGTVELIRVLPYLKAKGFAVKARFAAPDRYGVIPKLVEFADSIGVGDCVEFVGYLNRNEIDTFLSEADVFVFPTVAEGLPRVIIEAMAKGLPCITTPVSGNPELVCSHFLVDYNDQKTMADRIEELITNENLYEQTSLNNYTRSKKYEASVLQVRRDSFYTKLKERI